MEKLPVLSFLCFTILTISGISGNDMGQCKSLFQDCSTDSDCCSLNCHRTFYIFNKRCISPITVFESVKHMFSPKIDHVICAYNKPPKPTRRFPINLFASHDVLPIETKVIVTYNNLDITVQINGRPHEITNGERLYLSEDAAGMLGIVDGGLVPCTIQVPVLENNHIVKNILYMLPLTLVLSGLGFHYFYQ